jgi:hypothetical protein
MSLLEACSWLAAHADPGHGQLLVACADEGASPVLHPEACFPPLAAAFVLARQAPEDGSALACLGVPTPSEQVRDPARAADNPVAPALALVRAVFSGEQCAVHVNPASAFGYAVQIESFRLRATSGRTGVST